MNHFYLVKPPSSQPNPLVPSMNKINKYIKLGSGGSNCK